MEGAEVGLAEDGTVRIVPRTPVPAGLVQEVRANKAKVVAELRDEQEANTALLEWLPLRGSCVRDKKTGRTGTLWGVHGRGVTIAFGSDPLLITLDPREAELVTEE